MKEVAKHTFFMLIAVVLITAMVGAVSAAPSTSVHVVKYAIDGTTILDEVTYTYQELEQNFTAYGDGSTHRYFQGPTFNESDPYDPGEWQNVDTRDYGAVMGTDVKELCEEVGGMSPGEKVRIKATDNFYRDFSYEAVYGTDPRKGPMVLAWYNGEESITGDRQGVGYPPDYHEGMRLFFFADTSTNPMHWHVFGNWDMHETLPQSDWYNYSMIWPSSGGLSVKYVNRILIYSDDPVPTAPAAAFTSDAQSGTAPLTVPFTDQSTGSPTVWAWDFENDGTIDSIEQSPSHVYDTAGTYTVNLTVTNAGGSDSEVKADYISVSESTPAPVAAFTAKSVRILNGNFETGALDPWSASELVPYGDTPGVQIVTTGSYKKGTTGIRIWRTPVGGNAWIEQDVYLTDVEEIRFWRCQYAGTDRELQVLVDGTIVARYNETSGTINRYETIDLSSYSFTGTHTLRFNSYCYGGTALFSLYLDDIEGYGTTTSGTAPLTVQFTDASTGTIDSWAWDFENDGTVDSNDQNPSHVYDTPGTYTVKLTVTNAGGSDDEVKTAYITVTEPPIPWTLDLVGASTYTMPDTEFEALAAAHPVSWTDGMSNLWSGVSLWRLIALVDDADPASFNDTFAAAGYSVQIMASDGFSRQFSSADIARNDGRIVANRINGEYLSEDRFPLRFVGSGLTGGQMVSKISSIDLFLTITASADTGGIIEPSGSITTPYDGSQTFAITPDTGYHVSDVLVDGESVGAVTSYTFENVTAAHTIDARFAADGSAAPVAAFAADVTSGTAPLTVQFTDASTGDGITAWAWDFENDGTVDSTEQNPSFTYTSAGTYSVKLTATNAGGYDDEIKDNYITVNAAGGGLADTAWPTAYQNNRRTGLSLYNGPATTPQVKWTFNLGSGEPVIGPDGTLYTITSEDDCYLNAVNPADGSLKWKSALNDPANSDSATIGSDGTVYISCYSGLKALNPADGSVKWTVTPRGSEFTAPTIGPDGTIYITAAGDYSGIYAYNPDGTLKWEKTILHYYMSSRFSPGAAIADDGTIYFAGRTISGSSNTPVVRALNPNGTEKWNFTGNFLGQFLTLSLGSDGTIFTLSINDEWTQGCLYAIDPATGAEKWNMPLSDMGVAGAVIGPNDAIYLAGANTDFASGWLYALNPDGSQQWMKPWPGAITEMSVGADGTLYVADASADWTSGTLYALDPADGAQMWSYTLTGQVFVYRAFTTQALTIDSDGTLYAAAMDANTWESMLYAFKEPALALVAAFTSDVQSGTAPLTVQFTDASTGDGITAWAWDFGDSDSTNATVQHPVHTYDAAGTYTVNLTVTNEAGSDEEIKTDYITVTAAPAITELFNGTVTLTTGATFNVTAYNSGTSYTVNRTTPLGALDAAAATAGFTYDVTDSRWSADQVLMLDNVGAYLYNKSLKWNWLAYVNDAYKDGYMNHPDGLNVVQLADGDRVEYYYVQGAVNKTNLAEVKSVALAAVITTVDIPAGPSADILFDGDVNLAPGTFPFTAYTSSTEYQVDRLTPHGVLEEASRQAGFSYDASDKKWATMGTMLLDNVGIYLYDNSVSPKLCWAYQVNGIKKNDFSSTEGISVFRVNDTDLVEFYYGQDGGAFADAQAVIRGRVHIRDQTVLFDDDVTLLPGTFDFTAYNSGASYQINTTTPHGALDAASKIAGFTYNATDKKWGDLGTMLLDDVGPFRLDKSVTPNKVWAYAVNGIVKDDFSTAGGISSYQLQNNDRVEFFYGDKGDNLENATAVVRIRVHISSMDTWTLTLIGAQTTPISKQYFEEAVDCIHNATYTDVAGTWQGVPLWALAGYVDDANFHGPNAFNDTLAATNYTVKVIASDGFNKTFYSTQIARDNDYIVANTLNGQPLPVQYWPLKLVGADVPPSSSVAKITTIELSIEPILPPTESPAVRIIKYAADGVTEVANISVNITTMERDFTVIGNGTTVYRFEGINFVPNDIWDANETYPGGFKIENAVKGTRIRDLCELAGGMGSATDIRLVAKDGWETVLPYSSIYTNPAVQARQGDAILAWYADGKYVPEYVDGMRLFFTPDDHIYGQWDMHETLASNYWHYYYQDGIQYPSCAGLSAKWISTIKIYSAAESDWSLELDGTAIGGINYTVSKTYFEQALACQFGANHGVDYTDAQDNVWSGMPLWFLAGFVDDADQHSDNAFNDSLAAAGYDVKITARDGATLLVASRDIARNNNYIVANTLNGFLIPDESSSWPLRLVGPNATGSSSIKGISSIELVPASQQPSLRLFFSPEERSVFPEGSGTFTLVLSEAPEGLSGCNVTISLSNGSVATITDLTYPGWATVYQNLILPADSVTLKMADLTKQVEPGATNIAIATFTVRGEALGSTAVGVSVTAMDDDDGAMITPAVSPATFRVVVPIQPVNGAMPTDPDGDGLYDDLNGNGRSDFNDVVIYFNYMEWIGANEPVQYFDFNGNGRIDFDDVVELFWGV